MVNEKLILKTSKGKDILMLTLEEALAQGLDCTNRRGVKGKDSAKIRYTPLTDECDLSSNEKNVLIKACEQLGDKHYFVLTTARNGSVYGTIYIPDS